MSLISSCFCCCAGPPPRPLPPINSVRAVLFDVDGTLVDSDPLHYQTFREILLEVDNFNGGKPTTKEFYISSISGKHNSEVGEILFPDWDQKRRDKFLEDYEDHFRRLAIQHLDAIAGLHRLTEWIKKKNIHRAAVTNAPRESAEQMIKSVGLTDFFEYVVIGSECKRPKPYPDPYLKGLQHFGVSAQNAFAFEDSPSGLRAAVAAGLPVLREDRDSLGHEKNHHIWQQCKLLLYKEIICDLNSLISSAGYSVVLFTRRS